MQRSFSFLPRLGSKTSKSPSAADRPDPNEEPSFEMLSAAEQAMVERLVELRMAAERLKTDRRAEKRLEREDLEARKSGKKARVARPDLLPVFDEWNETHFLGKLPLPSLRWNLRLKTSAGRFIPGSRKYLSAVPPIIEIATYLLDEDNGWDLIKDTMGHEMIHFWLWHRRRPYGHTADFKKKMRELGVSRYATVAHPRPPKYLYQCPSCEKDYPAKRKLGRVACLSCCRTFSRGKFDRRFVIQFARDLSPEEVEKFAKIEKSAIRNGKGH